MFKKNTAVTGFCFALVSKTDGSPITSGTVTGYYLLDGGTQGTIAGAFTHKGNGQWSVNLLAAEMNGDVVGLLFSHASAIPVHFTIRTTTKLISEDVAITSNIKKNQALANFEFLMTDSTNHQPATGKTVTCTRSIDGGAFAAGTLANVAEVASGIYRVDFGAGDLNGNAITLRCTASAADDTLVTLVTAP